MRFSDARGTIVFESCHFGGEHSIVFEYEEAGSLKRQVLSLPDYGWMKKVFKHLQHQTWRKESLNVRIARTKQYLLNAKREFENMMYQ